MSLELLVVGWFRFHSLISQRQSFGDEASTATCSQSHYGLSQRCQLGYSVQLNRWFGFVCAQNAVWIIHSICICMGELCQSQPNSSRSSWTVSLNQFSKVNVAILTVATIVVIAAIMNSFPEFVLSSKFLVKIKKNSGESYVSSSHHTIVFVLIKSAMHLSLNVEFINPWNSKYIRLHVDTEWNV